jgi:hypothetical protein
VDERVWEGAIVSGESPWAIRSSDVTITAAYKILIHMPQRTEYAEMGNQTAVVCHDVGVRVGDETRTFTYDDFLTRLGFDPTKDKA